MITSASPRGERGEVSAPPLRVRAAARLPASYMDELVEGSLLVAEVGDGPGLLLWRALRDVRAWATAPEPLRPFVFHPATGPDRRSLLAASGVDERLRAPLCVLVRLVEERRPDPGRLLYACRRVARWAADRGAPVTCAAFHACADLVAGMLADGPPR